MGRTYYESGNVLLDDLLGARRLSFPEGENEAGADQALREEADRLRQQGRRPYVIPLGLDNPPLGALGYVLAAREVVEQGVAFDCAVVGSGSGYTHAGFLCGLRALGIRVPVHGACVRRSADLQRGRIATISRKLETLLGCPPLLGNDDVLTWDMALAPGYGRLGPEAREAIALMARCEGLFVDPVYTAKSLAVLIALARDGTIARGSRVLFIHTGGLPAIFAYAWLRAEIRLPAGPAARQSGKRCTSSRRARAGVPAASRSPSAVAGGARVQRAASARISRFSR